MNYQRRRQAGGNPNPAPQPSFTRPRWTLRKRRILWGILRFSTSLSRRLYSRVELRRLTARNKRVVLATVLVTTLVLVAAAYAVYTLDPRHGQNSVLGSYGDVKDLTYQGTTLSMVFTADTTLSLFSASISYTASNHQTSEQSYQTAQMPLGTQPSYPLTKGDVLKISFGDIPAGSLLLNIDVQVNASIGKHFVLLSYEVPQLETNSSQESS